MNSVNTKIKIMMTIMVKIKIAISAILFLAITAFQILSNIKTCLTGKI